MSRLARIARTAVPAVLALGIAACVVNIDFDLPPQSADVSQDPVVTGVPLSKAFAIDLSTQNDVQQHKGSIDHMGLRSVDLTITAVNTGGLTNTVTSISGSLALRPDGATNASSDVAVGSFTNFAINQGNKITVNGNPQADAFLTQTVKGTGKFSLVVTAQANGGSAAHFTVQAVTHASLGYNTGVF